MEAHQQQHEFAFALLCPGKQLHYLHKSVTIPAVRQSHYSRRYPAFQINNDLRDSSESVLSPTLERIQR